MYLIKVFTEVKVYLFRRVKSYNINNEKWIEFEYISESTKKQKKSGFDISAWGYSVYEYDENDPIYYLIEDDYGEKYLIRNGIEVDSGRDGIRNYRMLHDNLDFLTYVDSNDVYHIIRKNKEMAKGKILSMDIRSIHVDYGGFESRVFSITLKDVVSGKEKQIDCAWNIKNKTGGDK